MSRSTNGENAQCTNLTRLLKDSAIVGVSETFDLCVGHRPAKKLIPVLAALRFTHVVSVLGPREMPQSIGDLVAPSGMTWVWIPIGHGAVPDTAEERAIFVSHVKSLAGALSGNDRARVYLHCSAGIHRTGMVGLALLRVQGVPPTEARHLLARMRGITVERMGAPRMDFALSIVD